MITIFTNGCFDLLHPGHIYLLKQARGLALGVEDRLVVGVNSDESYRALRGCDPIIPACHRAEMVSAITWDDVWLFDTREPIRLILQVHPDILVKGGDYTEDQVVGGDLVKSWGGRVVIIPSLTNPVSGLPWSSSWIKEEICRRMQSQRRMRKEKGS